LKFSRQGLREDFASKLDEISLCKIRLKFENQSSIDPEIIFKRDRDRDEKFSSWVMGSVENLKSRFDLSADRFQAMCD